MFRQSYEFICYSTYEFILSLNNMNSYFSLNSQTHKAKELFLAINYNSKLGPFADTWDDLVDEFGSKLHFGKIRYQNHYVSCFQERVKPRDVKTALVLLSYLKLEQEILCCLIPQYCSSRHPLRVRMCITTHSENPIPCLLGLLLISCRC
jgi:hypothetical protein